MSLPEHLGRLRRIERIGAGGFASVWRYHDDELASDVAVKALADNWAQRLDIRDRFLEEARILRRADADHVVRVYDIGETESGTPYFVMSYADRGTVADLLADLRAEGRRLPLEEALDLVRQAGLGLGVLHRHGIVHRDIKPQNLLLRSTGTTVELLVADLGVAKATAQASGLTQVVGTPAFMAPEQARGTGVDERADVHALGAVAYLLLTDRLVREDGLGGLLEARLPPAPSEIADVPSHLDDAVLTALAPDREERWADVGSFLAALGQQTQSSNGHGPRALVDRLPAPSAESLDAPRRTSRTGTVLLALLVLVVTFTAAYVVTGLVR